MNSNHTTGHVKGAKNEAVAKYWHQFYCDGYCTLCGNSGSIECVVQKTNTKTKLTHRHLCICPNGQLMRRHGVSPDSVTIE